MGMLAMEEAAIVGGIIGGSMMVKNMQYTATIQYILIHIDMYYIYYMTLVANMYICVSVLVEWDVDLEWDV